MQKVRVIDNPGCGMCLLLMEKKGIGLIASPEKEEIIVGFMNEQDPNLWHGGTYFQVFDYALLEFKERTKG